MNRTEHEGEIKIERMSEREKEWEYPQTDDGGRSDSIFKQIRAAAADKLQTAAKTLHEKADRSGQPAEITALGHRAADWLERSADYVSEVEPRRLRSDIEERVRRNPGRSLLIAGIVGMALGGLLRRR